ncbi:hypothetical protein L208DRAFT_1305388, partial [Tricholoma matsutake]
KSVVIISILLQSTNESCNYLQSILGIFLYSTNSPKKVIETLAHAGFSISLSSIHCSVKSLLKEAEEKVRSEMQTLQTSVAYNNFDVHFKTSQPMLKHQSKFISVTLATLIPLFEVNNPSVLWQSRELWQADPRNPTASPNQS